MSALTCNCLCQSLPLRRISCVSVVAHGAYVCVWVLGGLRCGADGRISFAAPAGETQGAAGCIAWSAVADDCVLVAAHTVWRSATILIASITLQNGLGWLSVRDVPVFPSATDSFSYDYGRLVTGAAATKPPPPVIFVRVQVSHISCGDGALKLSGLLIFTRINLVTPTDKKENNRDYMNEWMMFFINVW